STRCSTCPIRISESPGTHTRDAHISPCHWPYVSPVSTDYTPVPSGSVRTLRALAFRGGCSFAVGDCRFGWRLLLLAHAIEAPAERLHEVDDLRRLLHVLRDDLAAGDLRVDDLLQPFAIFVLVVLQVQRRFERRDDLLGELDLFRLDL